MLCPAKRYMCVYYARFGLLGDFITSDNGINREDVEVLPYKSRGIAIVSFVGEGLRALPKSHRGLSLCVNAKCINAKCKMKQSVHLPTPKTY